MKGAKRVNGPHVRISLTTAAALAVLLLVASICPAGVRWTVDGVGIRTAAASSASNPQIAPDGYGGAIIVWQDYRGGQWDVFAQKILSNGSIAPGWAADGKDVRTGVAGDAEYPQVMTDGAGGAIITWQDYRSGDQYDIYAQKVLSNGSIAAGWDTDGKAVRSLPPYDAVNPAITRDGSGGAIITWRDSRFLKDDIFASRVLSNGSTAPGWAPEGVRIRSAAAVDDARYPEIVSDGSGGAVITWEDQRSGPWDVYAQRVLSNGSTAPGWAADGVGIRTVATGNASYPMLVPDGSGGAIITWWDSRDAAKYNVYAQRVLSSGATAWSDDGLGIRTSSLNNATGAHIAPDGSGGAIIAWQDNRSGSWAIYAKRILANGTTASGWAAEGIGVRTVSAGAATGARLSQDGSGGAIITWQDTRNAKSDIYAQRVLPSGAIAPGWAADGVGVRTAAPGPATAPGIAPDGFGGSVITWLDERSGKSDVYAQRASDQAPTVTGITASSGTSNSVVNVSNLAGTGFRAPDYGGGPVVPTVKLKKTGSSDITATNVRVLSSRKITCKLSIPANAASGKWDLYVANPDGQGARKANAFTVSSSVVNASTWYLAEGSTTWGFSTYISILNPNPSEATARITYMPAGGANVVKSVTLPPETQTTVNPGDVLGDKDFSTKVECTNGKTIAVDRTMTWNAGAGEEAHSSVGVTSPARTWYLPEGSSDWGFECWLLIQNPNPKAASCNITYMIENEGPKTVPVSVPANSRATYNMADHIGSRDASIKVESNLPVIPERAMYRNSRREGHDSIGTTTPATDYYLAEGACGYDVGYITYVLVQNPQTSPTDVSITYQTQTGRIAGPSFQMPANSRKTIRVNDQLAPGTDVSTHVQGSQPMIAERAMYWNNETGEACHDSIGMSAAHTTFYLPDGQISEGRETWTLVQNPNDTEVSITITYAPNSDPGGLPAFFRDTLPANSRKSYLMSDYSPHAKAATTVTCDTAGKKIMVERAMYWNNRGAGTDTIGGYGD